MYLNGPKTLCIELSDWSKKFIEGFEFVQLGTRDKKIKLTSKEFFEIIEAIVNAHKEQNK